MSEDLSEHEILDGVAGQDDSQRDFARSPVGLDKPDIAERREAQCIHQRASRVCRSV
jgi:hypothetical protein